MENETAHIKDLLRQFFEYLERTDTTDDGRTFHPVSLNCCRALWIEKLDAILGELKKYSKSSS